MTQTILITGATDGIGLSLARQYQQQGMRLILVGRRPLSDLDPSIFATSNYVLADLTQVEAADQIVDFLQSQQIHAVHVVIHNAGMGYIGHPSMQPPENVAELVAVNLSAPISLTQALLPYLRKAQGKLVFISSVATATATPDYAVYTATKVGLDGFARNLAIEWGKTVPILVVHVGATRTGMHRKAGADLDRMNWERFPAADEVAAQIRSAIRGSQREVTVGLSNRLFFNTGRLLGLWLDRLQIRMGR